MGSRLRQVDGLRAFADPVLWLILLAAAGLRIWIAGGAAYLPDESHEWIRVCEEISLDPDHLNLPVRTRYHPALPAYALKASSSLLGPTPLGYRMVSLIAGLLTVLLIYGIAAAWAGQVAGR